MFDLGANLRLGILDLALCYVQCAALTQFLVCTAACSDLPGHLPAIIFWALLYAGVTRVGTHHVFLAMQQLVDLGGIHHIGCRTDHALNQTRLIINADVHLNAEVILVALLGLVHFRVTLAFLVLGRTRRIDQRRIDDGALPQRQTSVAQISIDDSQNARTSSASNEPATSPSANRLADHLHLGVMRINQGNQSPHPSR